jgi:hypothetical protein
MGKQSWQVGGNCDQPRHASMQLASNRGCDPQAVHLGKVKIQERDVVVIATQGPKRLLAVGGDVDVMTALREQQL